MTAGRLRQASGGGRAERKVKIQNGVENHRTQLHLRMESVKVTWQVHAESGKAIRGIMGTTTHTSHNQGRCDKILAPRLAVAHPPIGPRCKSRSHEPHF
jgi:hypothetical protein